MKGLSFLNENTPVHKGDSHFKFNDHIALHIVPSSLTSNFRFHKHYFNVETEIIPYQTND
jgi:hypothetical protein